MLGSARRFGLRPGERPVRSRPGLRQPGSASSPGRSRHSEPRPPFSTAGFEQGSAAPGCCPAESDGRGPAIRYALPLRPPERSRGTTGRPALRPLDAGAAHLAAAAPKRARRPGALRAGCPAMLAKPLPLRDWAPNPYGRCFLSFPQGPSTDFRRGRKARGPVRPHTARRPVIADPGRDLRRQGQCPRRLRSGASAVTAGRPELSLEPVGTAGTAQHPAAIRKAFCDAALGPPARPEPG